MNAHAQERRRELRSYLIGLLLAILLTAIPFALVAARLLPRPMTLWAIAAAALVQALVHFRCFLHIDLSRSKRDYLQLVLFTFLIVLLMAGGTIWVLADLRLRMM